MDNLFSPPDSCKRCRHDVFDKKDVISSLPDGLLHHILSFLSTRDAIRTSLLARRWRFLWTYLSDFNIDVKLSSFHKGETEKQMINRHFNQVDTILQKAKFIKRFRFVAYGTPVDVDQAYSWIFALLKHKIQELELSLNLRSPFLLVNNLTVLKSLNMMNLEFGCVLKVPSCIHFPCLKTLTLQYITFVDETSAQQLFSGCPVLQKLTLFSCDWKNVSNVSIKIPTVTTLIIEDDCCRDNLLNCKVTIDAVNLRSLRCTNYLIIEFIPINLTSLAHAYIDVSNDPPFLELAQYTIPQAVKLLSGIFHVKSLILSKYTLEGFDPVCCSDGEAWTLLPVPHCLKSRLKLVSISDFRGREAEMQLLSFLSKNATNLRRIKIFCEKSLSADLKKQADISNQLRVVLKGFASCAIEFL